MSIGQNTAAAEKLTAFLERMEQLLDEIEGLKDDLKDLKVQARDEGFNVAALVRLVAIRRNKRRASQENELLNDLVLYAHATGTPLDFAFPTTRPPVILERRHFPTPWGAGARDRFGRMRPARGARSGRRRCFGVAVWNAMNSGRFYARYDPPCTVEAAAGIG